MWNVNNLFHVCGTLGLDFLKEERLMRGIRGLLAFGLIGLCLFFVEWFGVQAVTHSPLPVQVMPDEAKEIARGFLLEGPIVVRQEENAAVSRYLHARGLTDAFRKELASDKPLVYWKISSGEAFVLVNRQNGRVEGVRGVTLALVEGTEQERIEFLRKALLERLGVEKLFVSSIKCEAGKRMLVRFETGFAYAGMREVVEAELLSERWIGFSHRLEVPEGFGTEDPALANTVRRWAGILNLAVLAVPVAGFFAHWSDRQRGRKLYGEALISLSVAAAYWLKEMSLSGLLQGMVYGAIVFGALCIVWRGRLGLWSQVQEPGGLMRQAVAGYGVFGVLAGMSVLFLWAADALGAWSSDLQAQEAAALTPFPFLLPLFAAGAAAVYEELLYRKLGDVWLRRWTGSGIAAALLSSLIWSTAHLQYGVWPWYLRIVELGLLIGPALYLMYRRYGLVAVMTGHFLYNACLYSLALAGAFGFGWGFLWLLLPGLIVLKKRKGLPG
jgi:membrane protease YdiL (CAAX protease family)